MYASISKYTLYEEEIKNKITYTFVVKYLNIFAPS